ncbi:hypothetical protein MTO96_044418, partial [Rhipicephalus appendiculatus]
GSALSNLPRPGPDVLRDCPLSCSALRRNHVSSSSLALLPERNCERRKEARGEEAQRPWLRPNGWCSPTPAQSSGPSTSDTVSPSAYEREVVEVTPDFTSVTNSRERFVVVAMSALLLLISVTLFAVLFTLLSDDRTSAKSQEANYAVYRAFTFARCWSIRDI